MKETKGRKALILVLSLMLVFCQMFTTSAFADGEDEPKTYPEYCYEVSGPDILYKQVGEDVTTGWAVSEISITSDEEISDAIKKEILDGTTYQWYREIIDGDEVTYEKLDGQTQSQLVMKDLKEEDLNCGYLLKGTFNEAEKDVGFIIINQIEYNFISVSGDTDPGDPGIGDLRGYSIDKEVADISAGDVLGYQLTPTCDGVVMMYTGSGDIDDGWVVVDELCRIRSASISWYKVAADGSQTLVTNDWDYDEWPEVTKSMEGDLYKAVVTYKGQLLSDWWYKVYPCNAYVGVLEGKSLTMSVGQKFEITAWAANGDRIDEYVTNNKNVATINEYGVIKAKKVGTTTITVKSLYGGTSKIKIKVQKNKIKTKSLSVDTSTRYVEVGDSVSVYAGRTPCTSQQKVTYTSSNTKVAKVTSSGEVIPQKAGKCTITIKSGKVTKKVKIVATGE